jgi:hypothetical protein
MTPTQQFQHEVSRKLTLLFDNYINEIRHSESWNSISNLWGENQIVRRGYRDINEILEFNRIDLPCESETNKLFLCHKLIQLEVDKIREDNALQNSRITFKILECISEASSNFYENDDASIVPGHINGQSIYSPRVDLAIVPTIKYDQRIQPIGNYLLYNGRHIFELLEQLPFVQLLNRQLKERCIANYNSMGLHYENVEHNYRPLCLFALEIENQINKKHLMGDFINSLLLARFPVVLVPEDRLGDCLQLVKLSKIISNIKQVNIYDLLRRVMILSIPQFRSSIDQLLIGRGIEPLSVRNYR